MVHVNISLHIFSFKNVLSPSNFFSSLNNVSIKQSKFSCISIGTSFFHDCMNINVVDAVFTKMFKTSIIEENQDTISSGFFKNSAFSNALESTLFYVNNPSYSLEFLKCLLEYAITPTRAPFLVNQCYLCDIIDSCFYFCTGSCSNGSSAYGIETHIIENILHVAVNSTSEFKCGYGVAQYSSWCGGIQSFTFFHNNLSSNHVNSYRSGFCLTKYPSDVEVAAFARSRDCIGSGIFSIFAYQTGTLLVSNFDIINHTVAENKGLLELHQSFNGHITEFNFVLNSQRYWTGSIGDNKGHVIITNSVIIGPTPYSSSKVSVSAVQMESIVTKNVKIYKNSVCYLKLQPTRQFSANEDPIITNTLIFMPLILINN